jgi:hypothetical protein
VAASQIVRQMPLLKLAGAAILGMAVPLWLLVLDLPWPVVLDLPWPVVLLVLAGFGFCAPLVNAPLIGILTVRPPEALRPKVITAVMTISALIGPLGFVAVGLALQHVGMPVVFLAIAAGFTVGAVAFAAALRRGEHAPDVVPAI